MQPRSRRCQSTHTSEHASSEGESENENGRIDGFIREIRATSGVCTAGMTKNVGSYKFIRNNYGSQFSQGNLRGLVDGD